MEGRSLVRGGAILLALSLVRVGVEHRRGGDPTLADAPDRLEELREESLEARERDERRRRPLGADELLDPNRSPEEELDRLPGVGAATAKAMVESRETEGGFLGPGDLLRVRGIGPATLEKIEPHLDFSRGPPLELRMRSARGGGEGGTAEGPRPLTARALVPEPSAEAALPVVDVNRASAPALETLPGIGPALARRIIDSRLRDGRFRTPEDLLRVPGIGPATLERIRARVGFGG